MKRILVFLLAMAMVFASFQCAFAEEDAAIEIIPEFITSADKSSAEWYADETSRELFILSLIIDCLDTWSDADLTIVSDAIAEDAVYVAKEGYNVIAFFFGQNDLLLFRYGSLLDDANYAVVEVENAATLSSILMIGLKG